MEPRPSTPKQLAVQNMAAVETADAPTLEYTLDVSVDEADVFATLVFTDADGAHVALSNTTKLGR